ncbi:MAG: PqqD family peptide modification chaperone [Methylobacter sp.]
MSENELSTHEKIQRADDFLGAVVGDELLMMSIEKGSYYSLNSIGARIWELLESPIGIDGLVARLTEEYNVPVDTCRQEVARFIEALRERGLIN